VTTPSPSPVQAGVPPGPVVYSVTVNGAAVTDWVLDVELMQTWGYHDIFIVRIEYNRMYNITAGSTGSITPWADNAPVQIVWGRVPQTIVTWYGYVNHHTLSTNSDSGMHNLQYTYYCIGTSKPMNTVSSKNWGNVTPTYIAQQMALKYQLRCVVTSTTWTLTNEIQANESDFSYMNRIAAKTGYRFWVGGGTMYFIDPAVVLIATSTQLVPNYFMYKRLDWQDTIRDFHKFQGDNLPGSLVATRNLYGIDPTTGQFFTATTSAAGGTTVTTGVPATTTSSPTLAATGTTGFLQTNTVRTATTASDAQQHVNSWQALSQWWIAGNAELFGTTLLYPGKVVHLQGDAMPSGDSGFWIVGSVRHLLKTSLTTAVNDKYVTKVSVLRNASAAIPYKQAQQISPEFVTMSLSGGVWVSSDTSSITDNSGVPGISSGAT
jgi:phage protein D